MYFPSLKTSSTSITMKKRVFGSLDRLLQQRPFELRQMPSFEMIIEFLSLGIFIWYTTFVDLHILNPCCIPGMKSNLIMVYDVFLNSVCNYFLENFFNYGHQRNWFLILSFCYLVLVPYTGFIESVFNSVPSCSVKQFEKY